MVTNGLRDAGFEFLNLDDGWAVNRSAAGVLIADPKLFPPSAPGKNDGIKLVADYVHSKQLKFGIYTARGNRTCLGRPGSDSHEQQDADTWASWGDTHTAAKQSQSLSQLDFQSRCGSDGSDSLLVLSQASTTSRKTPVAAPPTAQSGNNTPR